MGMLNLVILNNFATEYLGIFLHGIGDNAINFSNKFKDIANEYPNIKFVFPEAPINHVDIQDPALVNSWYSIKFKTDPAFLIEDKNTMDSSLISLNNLIKGFGVDTNKIIVGGHSLGASMAYYLASNTPERFLGVGIFDGYAPLVLNNINQFKQDFYVFHGKNDNTIPLEYALLSYNTSGSQQAFKTFNVDAEGHQFDENEVKTFI